MVPKRLALTALLAICGFAFLTGCDHLTRSRFEMIEIGYAERFDVEKTIGEPSYPEIDNMWHYERVDKHLNVMVHFDEQGKVWRKEWLDGKNDYDSMQKPEDSSTYESTTVKQIH